MAPIADNTDGGTMKICVDMARVIPYNPAIMDSLNVFLIPTEALSSLLLWNWWAASPAR